MMIKKLMKYDIKKMFWVLGYIYVIALVLSVITRVINIGKDIQLLFILGQIFAGIVYAALGSILVNTFVQILRVFNNNFYKDESYLTHTLPINKSKLLLSKYLSALIVILSSVLVIFACLLILFLSQSFIETLKLSLTAAISGFDISMGAFITLFVLIVFSQICFMISMAFAAVVKANTYNSKRVLKGFLWFALFYYAAMVVTLFTVAMVFLAMGNISQLFAATLSKSAFMTILVVGLICYVAYVFIFYFVCRKIFSRGVNVD